MLELIVFFKTVLIGLIIAMPIGPVTILCIQKTLKEGRLQGYYIALGATVADTIYGVIAVLGLHFVLNFALAHQFWIKIIQFIILTSVGIHLFRQQVRLKTPSSLFNDSLKTFSTGFLLNITNPLTVLGFLSILILIKTNQTNFLLNTLSILGIFIGTVIWWLIVCGGAQFFSKKISSANLTRLNKITAIFILLFSSMIFLTLFKHINL